MAGFTTAMPTSFKLELLQGHHTFNGSGTATCTCANAANHVTSVSSMANISPGCLVAGTNIPAATYVGFIDTATSFWMTNNATGTITAASLTFTGNNMYVALGKASPTGTYDATTTNYSTLTGNSDEIPNGTGYTTGGYAITAANNTTPASASATGYTTPGINPSWTSATISTSGCIMYNGPAAAFSASNLNKAVYVGSFGGTQTVTAGTLTLLMPTNNSSNALLRLA